MFNHQQVKELFWLRISVEKCVLSEELKMLTLNRFWPFFPVQ